MIEAINYNHGILCLSPKIIDMHNAEIIKRNKYNKFCMKLLHYLNRKDLQTYLNDAFSSENNPYNVFQKFFGKNEIDMIQLNLNIFKGTILLSLYFSKYPYILNLLPVEIINEISNGNIFEPEWLYFLFEDKNKAIDKLSKKIIKGESILDDGTDIRTLQMFMVHQLSIQSKIMFKTNLCEYYQIKNFLRNPDFCLKLIIWGMLPYLYKLKSNFIDELIISLNISDMMIKQYILYFYNIIAQNKNTTFNDNEIKLINNSLTIKDFIVYGDDKFHKKFLDIEKKN